MKTLQPLCLEITLKSLSRKLNELNEAKIVAMGSSVSRARFEYWQKSTISITLEILRLFLDISLLEIIK